MQNENRPLLSLAVPTYNRVGYLKELMPELLSQCDELDPARVNIEILVSDNCSTDDTHDYLVDLATSRVKYYKNETNIGGDANFIECVKKSNGNYVWIFGDDEKICVGGMRKVFEILSQKNVALVITNSCLTKAALYFKNYQNTLNYFKWTRDRIFPIHHTLLTTNVFKRKLFDIDKAYALINTHYGHMYALLDRLKFAQGIYVFRRNEIFTLREQRASFAVPPENLEQKLIDYVFYLGDVFNDRLIKINVWLFYKFFNQKPYRFWRKRIVSIIKFFLKRWRTDQKEVNYR